MKKYFDVKVNFKIVIERKSIYVVTEFVAHLFDFENLEDSLKLGWAWDSESELKTRWIPVGE